MIKRGKRAVQADAERKAGRVTAPHQLIARAWQVRARRV